MKRRQSRPQGAADRPEFDNGQADKQALAPEILGGLDGVKAPAEDRSLRVPQSPHLGIFAGHALRLRSFGLAVLPADGKKPFIEGWRRWRGPPSPSAIAQLAKRFPDANVAILPGPSKLFIADVDRQDQAGEVERLLGRTPLHVRSRRGVHLYYRDRPGTHELPPDLAGIGLKVDLKAGNSIVIAPPSRHESGVIYRHDGCDWNALDHLPEPNCERLRKALPTRLAPDDERLAEGHRGLGLNRILCRHATSCDTFDDLLDVARTHNADFLPPLPDSEVVKRARQVWRDTEAGKLALWVGRKAVTRTSAAEIKRLCALGRNGSDAVTLLMLLRAEHGARCRRGETFCLAVEAMQREQTVPGWSSKRYTAARDVLLNAGLIVVVSSCRSIGSRWLPAEYRLAAARDQGAGQSSCIVSEIGRREAMRLK